MKQIIRDKINDIFWTVNKLAGECDSADEMKELFKGVQNEVECAVKDKLVTTQEFKDADWEKVWRYLCS